jgi:hypothetical protein
MWAERRHPVIVVSTVISVIHVSVIIFSRKVQYAGTRKNLTRVHTSLLSPVIIIHVLPIKLGLPNVLISRNVVQSRPLESHVICTIEHLQLGCWGYGVKVSKESFKSKNPQHCLKTSRLIIKTHL